MHKIPDASVNLIINDLPYGTTACKWDSIIPFESLWEHYKRILKPIGTVIMFGSQPFTSSIVGSNIPLFKYELIWEKSRGSNFVHANFQPLKCHENIVIFSKGGSAQGSKNPMTYNPQHTPGKPYAQGNIHIRSKVLSGGNTQYRHSNETGERKPRSVLYYICASDADGNYHPTQKPVALLEYLIKIYSNIGDIVLDNTMGSGTAGVASVKCKRRFLGIEQEQEYYDIACKRIKETMRTLF